MSYLNPYMLAALVAAAIPVILHLLNLQKAEKIEFSSIMLLKEMRKSRFRKLRIKQFLLMLIRLLTIVFLVLAFADPYLKNISGKGTDVKKTALIVVDTSYSMNVVQDSVNLRTEAVRTAEIVKGLFTSSDKVIRKYAWVNSGDTVNPELRPDMNSILKTVGDKTSGRIPDEVYVITDMQKVNFNLQPAVSGKDLSAAHFYFLDISQAVSGNVSINNVYVDTKIPGPGSLIRLRAAVKNEGANYITGARVKLFADNELKAEKSIDLKPEERTETGLEFMSDKYGFISCRVELSGISGTDNSLKEDDACNFGIYIPEKIKIGILKSGNADTRYLTSVFDAANMNTGRGVKVFDYSILRSAGDISGYDVLFLAGYDSKEASETDELKKFLGNGKGVFMFPSEAYQGDLLNSIASVHLGKKTLAGKYIRLTEIKSFEPMFEGVFRGKAENGDVSGPLKASTYYEITAGGSAFPVISMDNKMPFLILDKSNYGLVAITCLAADKTMSDFPENEIFAPLILRSAVYLAYQGLYLGNNNLVANHDTLESNTSKADKDFLNGYLRQCGIKNFDIVERKDIGKLENLVNENRKGKSLWFYALLVVILLVVSELIAIKKVYSRSE